MTAMMFGPPLILDMSFLTLLKPSECSLTAKQVSQLHHDNRAHRFPHHLMFTGCKRNHFSWEDIERVFPDGFERRMFTVTDKHYLDLFPREQLVYLSPDAKIPMAEYEPDKVYIIAGIVDRISRPNLTLGRAKEEGIECKRLPLERCIR